MDLKNRAFRIRNVSSDIATPFQHHNNEKPTILASSALQDYRDRDATSVTKMSRHLRFSLCSLENSRTLIYLHVPYRSRTQLAIQSSFSPAMREHNWSRWSWMSFLDGIFCKGKASRNQAKTNQLVRTTRGHRRERATSGGATCEKGTDIYKPTTLPRKAANFRQHTWLARSCLSQ